MRKKAATISNLLIIILEAISFVYLIWRDGFTTDMLVYYTRLSNLLALIAGILVLIYIFRNKESSFLPKWLMMFRYIVTIMLSITFIISLFVLSRYVGLYKVMISEHFKFHHTLCPLISAISFICFEKGERLSLKDNFLSTLPTLIYGITMLILNAAYVLRGPYPFLLVYEQSVPTTIMWIIGIYFGTFLIGSMLRFLNVVIRPPGRG